MGTLTRFDLGIYGCDVFFETGTGSGGSLAYALENGRFKKLYSVEIHPRTAERASFRFRGYRNVKIINSDSVSALQAVLSDVSPASRILFFLDAHFPGEVDEEFRGYKCAEAKNVKLPLAEELAIIRESRPTSNDIIIIDDLRIYEEGPFESGNMPEWAETLDPVEKNIEFIEKTFPNRYVRKYYWDEGYILVSSKRKACLRLGNFPRGVRQFKTRVTGKIRKLLCRTR